MGEKWSNLPLQWRIADMKKKDFARRITFSSRKKLGFCATKQSAVAQTFVAQTQKPVAQNKHSVAQDGADIEPRATQQSSIAQVFGAIFCASLRDEHLIRRSKISCASTYLVAQIFDGKKSTLFSVPCFARRGKQSVAQMVFARRNFSSR